MAIAESLGCKVYVSREKKGVVDCLEDEVLSGMVTQDADESNLHVVQMGKLNLKDLEEYANGLKRRYDKIVGKRELN